MRFNRTPEFKERYRSIDVLLIDDIQFLAGKERTQEEFFHTFNALYDAPEADRPVTATSRRGRSRPWRSGCARRFEWGLIADIQPPDLETKIAILRQEGRIGAVDLPDDVALFIASHVQVRTSASWRAR